MLLFFIIVIIVFLSSKLKVERMKHAQLKKKKELNIVSLKPLHIQFYENN